MNDQEVTINAPKDLANYAGAFVLFYPEDKDPKVLFSSVIAAEAYAKATEIEAQIGKLPLVYRVQENTDVIISHSSTA